MTTLFVLPVFAILCVAMLRRALPIGSAAASATVAWDKTHDLFMTCVVGFLALCLTAAILDRAASATSPRLRRLSVAAEGLATAASAAFLALVTFQHVLTGAKLAMSIAFAGLLGFGIVLRWRERAR